MDAEYALNSLRGLRSDNIPLPAPPLVRGTRNKNKVILVLKNNK
jgi:hypothetical protein